MEMDDLTETLRTAQNIMIHRGVPTNKGHKLPAAAPEIGGALYYPETGGGGDRNGARGSGETRTCWACGKPGHIVTNCPDSKARGEYDAKRGNGKGKAACDFCDQAGQQHNVCPVKKALIAGKNVGMVDGSMRVLVMSAHEQQPPAATTDLYEPIEDLCGLQEFDISCFSVAAVHEPETPPVTANWQLRSPLRRPERDNRRRRPRTGDGGDRSARRAGYLVRNGERGPVPAACSAGGGSPGEQVGRNETGVRGS
jgi:hypothetical protein